MRRRAPLILLAALAGCTQILGLEDPTPPPDADVADFTCAAAALEATASVDTTTAPDGVTLSCGSPDTADVALAFTAPATDYYLFSTDGSSFDTVLGVLDECGGTELGCSQNVDNIQPHSEVVAKVERGEQVLVVVDGFAGARGAATVTASPVTCPNQDLEGRTFPLTLNSTSGSGDIEYACLQPGVSPAVRTPGPHLATHWVAPSAGLWAFRASTTLYSLVLSLHRGPRCSDPQMACGGFARTAEVVRYLDAGEVVSLVIDSVIGSGELELDIKPRAGACPEAGVLPVAFDDNDGELSIAHLTERTLAPSCGPIERYDAASDSYKDMGDTSYALTTLPDPESFSVTCGVVATSQQPFILYALAGADCSGDEVACVGSTVDGNGLHNATISLRGDKDVAVPYTVVVAADSLTPDSVTLRSSCTRIATAR